MVSQWKPCKETQTWIVKRSCTSYKEKHDLILDQMAKLSYADDLLSGNNAASYYIIVCYCEVIQLLI